jgi:hypothetical protein
MLFFPPDLSAEEMTDFSSVFISSTENAAEMQAKSVRFRERMAQCKVPKFEFENCACKPAWASMISVRLLTAAKNFDLSAEWPVPEDKCHNCFATTSDTSLMLMSVPCRLSTRGKAHDVTFYACAPCVERLRQCSSDDPTSLVADTALEKFCVMRFPDTASNKIAKTQYIDTRLCASKQCGGAEQGRMKRFKACSRCKKSYYCSEKCQVQHWPTHSKRCAEKK